MHHAIGILGLIAAIAFAFGERTARACVGVALILAAAAMLYVMYAVVMGTI